MKNRLVMDGSTKAAEFASFATTTDTAWLADDRDNNNAPPPCHRETMVTTPGGQTMTVPVEVIPKIFIRKTPTNLTTLKRVVEHVAKVATLMKNRGYFKKPWILFPMNLGNYHWQFVGLLNVSYLGTPQAKKFSGFFIYDGLEPKMGREKQLAILSNQGILNLIIYINLVYGHPNITGQNIREMVFNQDMFAEICVPDEDIFVQSDGFNCGIFIWLCLQQMSLSTSRQYREKKDFNEVLSTTGDKRFYFHTGEWFKLYRDATHTPDKASGFPKFHKDFFSTIRAQATALFNRLLTLKVKGEKNYQPRDPPPDKNFPKFVKHNFRKYVFEIPDTSQERIDDFIKHFKGNSKRLNRLLHCRNNVISNTHEIILTDDNGDVVDDFLDVVNGSSASAMFTNEQLTKAGLNLNADDNDDDNKARARQPDEEGRSDSTESEEEIAHDEDNANKEGRSDSTESEGDENANDDEEDASQEQEEKRITDGEDDGIAELSKPDWKSVSLQQQQHNKKREGGIQTRRSNKKQKTEPPTTRSESNENEKAGSRTTPTESNKKKKKEPRKTPRTEQEDNNGRRVPLPGSGEKVLTEDSIKTKYKNRGREYYPKSQQKISLAMEQVSKVAGLPNTKGDLENWSQNERDRKRRRKKDDLRHDRQANIDEMTTKWENFQIHKKKEAQLYLYDSVKAIQYVPPQNDGHDVRKGVFNVKLRGNKEEIVEVSREWVLQHFEEDVVKAAVSEALSNFVKVDKDIKILIDNRQIQKLRWRVPKPQGNDYSLVRRNNEPYFQGITSDGKIARILKSFVKTNFPKEFVTKVVEQGKTFNEKFLHVPPGAPRTLVGHHMMNDQLPMVKYMQGGDATCLFSSLASALHYVGLRETAEEVARQAARFSAASDNGVLSWKGLLETMAKSCRWLDPIKIKSKSFDILSDVSMFPTVLALEAVDGGTQHAITVVGKLIFDSNCERALPLTRKSLDYCCSTDKKQGMFRQVYRGYRYMEERQKKVKVYDKVTQKNGVNFFWDIDCEQDDNETCISRNEL